MHDDLVMLWGGLFWGVGDNFTKLLITPPVNMYIIRCQAEQGAAALGLLGRYI